MQPSGVVPRPAVRRHLLRRASPRRGSTAGRSARRGCPIPTGGGSSTSAAAAERDGFRPCLRCRPELAPGRALCDAVPRLARAAAHPDRRGRAQRPGRGGAGARAGRGRAPSPARDGAGARRVAGRAGADPPPAPRQVPAGRHRPAGDAGRVRQRISEPPPVQLRVPGAIPDEPERAPADRRARPGGLRAGAGAPIWCG